MAEKSAISWTRSTFNPWIGCTKIGPGCDLCYADQLDATRLSKTLGGGTKDVPIRHWGAGAPRYRTSIKNWHQPLRWNKQAPESEFAGRKGFWPVFCSSLADVFDNEVPKEWRSDLWDLIDATPNLSWLLVTKRIGNVDKMVPPDWMQYRFPDNVRLLITVCNQEEANRDIPKLLKLKCKNGVSYEPALGPVDWVEACGCQYCGGTGTREYGPDEFSCHECDGHKAGPDEIYIDWIIVGGESKQGNNEARPFDIDWAADTIKQCRSAGVPVFIKQMGSRPYLTAKYTLDKVFVVFPDSAGANPSEWGSDLCVQEFPE